MVELPLTEASLVLSLDHLREVTSLLISYKVPISFDLTISQTVISPFPPAASLLLS